MTDAERPLSWSLRHELQFVDALSPRVLRKYDTAIDQRRRWWPAFRADDLATIKAHVSKRLQELTT